MNIAEGAGEDSSDLADLSHGMRYEVEMAE